MTDDELPDLEPDMTGTVHVPVMLQEVLDGLGPTVGSWLCDGTLGGGGHTAELASRVGPSGHVLAVDRDAGAVERASARFTDATVTCHQASYADLPDVVASVWPERAKTGVDGIMLDLGLSSDQLADASRGFSYLADGDLDLRFDTDAGEPAWRLIARLSEKHLADVIYQYGEERFSRRIAARIVAERRKRVIRTATDLAEIVRFAVPPPRRSRSGGSSRRPIHPATRTFQALRIAVNGELDELTRALTRLPDLLATGGRLVIISFHSLEDRLVKHAFRNDPRLQVVTKSPLIPTEHEVAVNPRARSAKLRVAVRNDAPPGPPPSAPWP